MDSCMQSCSASAFSSAPGARVVCVRITVKALSSQSLTVLQQINDCQGARTWKRACNNSTTFGISPLYTFFGTCHQHNTHIGEDSAQRLHPSSAWPFNPRPAYHPPDCRDSFAVCLGRVSPPAWLGLATDRRACSMDPRRTNADDRCPPHRRNRCRVCCVDSGSRKPKRNVR